MIRIKTVVLVSVLSMTMVICGCGKSAEATISIPVSEATPESLSETLPETEGVIAEQLSDDQALEAIRNYCCTINPDLDGIAAEGYSVYWEIASSDDSEIVILFRSYTGAQVHYYIDRDTGIATITEFVPGIMDEEESTGESINVRDYLN